MGLYVLAVDELGVLPLHRHAVELLFQVYEQGSVAIATNLGFGHWNTVINHDRQTAAVSRCTFYQTEAVMQQVESDPQRTTRLETRYPCRHSCLVVMHPAECTSEEGIPWTKSSMKERNSTRKSGHSP